MLRYIINALLADENGRTGVDDFVNHALEHALLLIEECFDLVRTVNPNLCIELGLGHLYRRVNQGDFGSLDFPWHSCMYNLLIDYHALHELGFGKALALLLDNLNHVDVCSFLAVDVFGDLQDCLDSDVREVVP